MLKSDAVDRALVEIEKGYAQYQYFFDSLTSPAWLVPLSERGFFKHPPAPEVVEKGVRLPFWPESRYLVRMCGFPEVHETVLLIALGIPASQNSRVYDDIADTMLSLPARLAAKLVDKAAEGVRLPIKLLLKYKLGDLIAHLADGGESQAATALAKASLALGPDSSRVEKEGQVFRRLRPQALIEDWHYADIISKSLPALVRTAGIDSVKLFCDLLDHAIGLSRAEPEDEDGDGDHEDYLYISHPAIEGGSRRDDISGILMNAVRDAAEQLVAADSTQFTPILQILTAKRWVSFRRLMLHLCRVFPDQGLAVGERLFQKPEILNVASLEHESVLLLKQSFSNWDIANRQRLVDWVDRGLSEDSCRRWLEFIAQPATADAIAQISDVWRRDHFAVIQGQMPERYEQKLDALIARLGAPRELGKPRIGKFGAVGAESPKAADDFEQMSVDEIVGFLASWCPGANMFEATAEGAGRRLQAAVEAKPERFVASAAEFASLDPTYVRALFAGLTVVVKGNRIFDWAPVLELACSIAGQPRDILGRKGGLMVADPDWGWSRDAIIDLMSEGLDEDRAGCLTIDNRAMVWNTLRPLTDDPTPSPADEISDPRSSKSAVIRGLSRRDAVPEEVDPATLSINATRGRAMHAVFKYARWLRIKTDAARKGTGNPSITFDDMPEVRDCLSAHLEIDKEPTRTVRSVYGNYLRWLGWLDLSWLRSNLERIFPCSDSEYPFFRAAWNSFVIFNPAIPALLPELVPLYRKAIGRIGKDTPIRHSVRQPEECLAEHLMVYYWRGDLQFDGDDKLLDEFYATASPAILSQAMEFVGTSVSAWGDEPPEVFARLRDLAALRIEATKQGNSTTELVPFGYWFLSNKFDESWSLQTLVATLSLSKRVEPAMQVIEHLAEISQRYPVECVACLRLMVEGDAEGWMLIGVEDDARKVLQEALDSGNMDGAVAARRLIEDLIAKGQFGFRSLLT
jgi:hypothetical protein